MQSPLFKDLVPSTVENGQIKLSGGTKSDMGSGGCSPSRSKLTACR
ncbi:hypothetical protein V5O39_19725 [Pseudomonas parakoreensis]